MPRVSEDHKEARREQILTAAVECVAREGFHRASMSQIIEEAGLSAGAVYRYFASKDDIIKAVADGAFNTMESVLTKELDRPGPMDVFRVLEHAFEELLRMSRRSGGDQLLRVAVQVWAEAARETSDVRPIVAHRVAEVLALWQRVIERAQADGTLDVGVDSAATARSIFSVMPGFVIHRLVIGRVSPAAYVNGLRSLATAASVPVG